VGAPGPMWPLTNSLARRGTSWARLDDLVDPTRTCR
jgi:hypothetical protein